MKRVFSALVVCALCLGMCSCGQETSDADPATTGDDASATASPSASESVGHLAASMKDYMVYVYNREKDKGEMSETQLAMVERAAENGSVSEADYEAAWNNFKSCMVDLGYTTPVLMKFPNGIYEVAGGSGGTPEQLSKFSTDYSDCMGKEVVVIKDLYGVQVGNPDLISDTDAGIVDCLHKADVVPASYTKQQYLKEKKANDELQGRGDFSEGYSFDRKDPKVRGCFSAFGTGYLDGTDPNETLWYPFPDDQPSASPTE